MALGLNTSPTGGDFLPICAWDARAGRFFRVEREQQSDGSWMSNKLDITNSQPSFVADFGSISVGYIAFTPTGPSFELVPLGSPLPAKPTPDHKQGMRLKLFSPKNFGGAGLREFASSAKSVLNAIDVLHSEFEAAPEAAAGQLPVVKLEGSTAVTTKGPQGNVTSYAPVLRIISWVERPTDLGERTVPAPRAGARTSAPPAQPPAAPPANHVPPPAPKAAEPKKEMALADDEVPF